MRKSACVLLVFLFSVTIGVAGDTITNVWGTLSYGWVDAETFGIQFQGSSQIRQIEQDWSNSALLITNVACRFNDNVYAWQIRKSEGKEALHLITNNFARAQSYVSDPPNPQTQESALYSEFELLIPKTFDSHNMMIFGDRIEIWLCIDRPLQLFSFTVPPAPPLLEEAHGPAPEADESRLNDQPSETGEGNVQTAPSGALEDQPTGEAEGGHPSQQPAEDVASSSQSVPSSLPEKEPASEQGKPASDDEASTADSRNVLSSPPEVAEEQPVSEPGEALSNDQAMEENAIVQVETLRDSYVQGETIQYSFAPASTTNGKGNLTVLRVDPGEESTVIYHDAIAWEMERGCFTFRLHTGDLAPGHYDLVIWVNGEMEPRRHRIEMLPP